MTESESLGKRIAHLRIARGWTQERLAERLAVSRVAVSHIEMGLTMPGERTVVILAGLFGIEPPMLVAGTSYPIAKRERLPAVAARYTEAEHLQHLLESDLTWLASGAHRSGLRQLWLDRLDSARQQTTDTNELALLRELEHRVVQFIPA
ncbi:MAG: helix-turn-helix transcriptional regulator [Chloroflexi bacterium]|nr:helix-turn-helix transcriptional regulator [Chloroflexota bacterium]